MEIDKNLNKNLNYPHPQKLQTLKQTQEPLEIGKTKLEDSISLITISIEDILSNLEINLNKKDQSLVLINNLMLNNLPVTKENLKFLNNSLNLFNDKNIEKAIFLLKNNLNITESLSSQLDICINKEENIISQVLNILAKPKDIKITENILKSLNVHINLKEAQASLNNFKNIIETQINLNDYSTSKELSHFIKTITSTKILFEKSNFLLDFFEILKNDSNLNKLELLKIPSYKNLPLEEAINNTNPKEINLPSLENILKDFPLLTKDKFVPKEFLKLIEKDSLIKSETINFLENLCNLNKKVKDSLTFKVKNSKKEDLNAFFNNLKSSLNKIDIKEFKKTTQSLSKNIDFMSGLKENIYLQLPLNINNQLTLAELYVFKEKYNKSNSKNKSSSALISLDLPNLGYIEAYINKINENLSIQFKISNKYAEILIKENLNMLESYFSSKNLKIASINFKPLKEKFTLTSNIKTTNSPISLSLFNKQI